MGKSLRPDLLLKKLLHKKRWPYHSGQRFFFFENSGLETAILQALVNSGTLEGVHIGAG